MDVNRVFEIIDEEISGYIKWLNATNVPVVINILNNKIDALNLLKKMIERKIKKEGDKI